MSQAPAQDSQEQWRKIVSEHRVTVSSYWRKLQRRYGKMPRWMRIGSITLLLVAALTTVYILSPTDTARLQLICQYNLRSAQLSVMVDGSPVYTSTLNAATKKRLGVIPKGGTVMESFSRVINVPPGRHAVQVHVSAPNEGFDQERSVAGYLTPDHVSVLNINAIRRNAMAVNFEGAPLVQAASHEESRSLPKGGLTIIFSILGTMLSASISFLVQEFWRAYKNRMTASQ